MCASAHVRALMTQKSCAVGMRSRDGGSLEYLRTPSFKEREVESSSNLRSLKGKRQCFSIFYDVNMSTKSKTDSEFPRVSFDDFFFIKFGSVVITYNSYKIPYFC